MGIVTVQELIESGVHYGHRASRWNPRMAPFIHGKRNTIHVIDLRSTVRGLVRACHFAQRIATEGRDVLFVGTKRGAKAVVQSVANAAGMPCVVERWLGGTLTNFETIRRRLVRLEELEAIEAGDSFAGMRKKDLSRHMREKRKLLKNLSGIRKMATLPGAIVIVDPRREHIAVKEANRMGIPVLALLDTDCDPELIDIPIPGNDDSMRSVETILRRIGEAVQQGVRIRPRTAQSGAPGASEDALAESLRGSGGVGRGAKRVVVRRHTGAAPANPVAAEPAAEAEAPAGDEPAAATPAG